MKYKAQPRIKGIKRVGTHEALLPIVREGLEEIAQKEKRSVSWVISQLVADYFDLEAATGLPQTAQRKVKRLKFKANGRKR